LSSTTYTKSVLDNRRGDHNLAADRFVAIDRVLQVTLSLAHTPKTRPTYSNRNCGKRNRQETEETETDNDDGFPWPFVLTSDT
jgi:hypothetical protein